MTSCANCTKTGAELKSCARCHTVHYCNRDCQKSHWKTHKKACGVGESASRASVDANAEHSNTYSAPRLKNLEKHVPKPFTDLDQGTYLHDRPEADVFKILIDSFRMAEADDYNFEMKITPDSVYSGAGSSSKPFRQFLAQAATRSSLLPPWWSDAKVQECVEVGESGAWSDLRKKVTKTDIIERYGDGQMPMQLRMLRELMTGRGPMGQDGTPMRKQMVQVEKGGLGGGNVMSMLNLNVSR